ncbi:MULTISPECIES: hypothetical protein [Agrobacterium tumefaciens complex]|uniref:Phage abortive infection protein n=1 Tax=Agrobacterium tomkonis CFBP 6623 TaxID=1183432 RepID=A0A1S7S694_9HYPH|nr:MULTISPECIES: hypothetical protein [Agrobacterium tumefaciens complex]QCL90856.1 hypothetical protein CFBP6623_16650 [Agrobacterium tumefaciens]CUX63370.1 conserved hypothetical protein [Agrobacterium tomkonis CFBP 6623]
MKSVWNRINWLIVALVSTTAYITFIVWKVEFYKIWVFLSSPDLNEVGDFLAGVFSPLAFIWLVAAVLTQRQELVETRTQFKENQEVVDAQLRTINKQSELLQQQHTLAEETAKKTYRLSLFGERYNIYSDFVKFGKKFPNMHDLDAAYLELNDLIQRARFVFGDDICDWFEEISDGIYDLIQLRQCPKVPSVGSYGETIMKFDDETRVLINERRSWLTDQFRLPTERDRFYNSMRINDN